MAATPPQSEAGAMLTALGSVVMTTIAALEQTGTLNPAWTAAIVANAEGLIDQFVRDEAEHEAVLRSLRTIESMLAVLRASPGESGPVAH